jgi:hypothetical protein
MSQVQTIVADVFANLTGFSLDLTTVLVSMVGIFVILLALDVLKDVLLGYAHGIQNRRDEQRAETILWCLGDRSKTMFQRDVLKTQYRSLVSRRSRRG